MLNQMTQVPYSCNNQAMSAASAPTRCAIYLRISLDATGDQLAVQRQREDCSKIAEQRGWRVVAEYVDNSVSASDRRKVRPGYDALVDAYGVGAFDALVCWDLDRLTRQPRQLEDWIDAAAERGLLLVTANGEADLSTDGGRMYARIKASVARAEVERKSARQKRAAVQRSEQGRPPLGTRLTGYTPAGVVVEQEAAVIAEMFERFAAGDSLRSLAASLTEAGVPTRHGSQWSPSTVHGMLRNPRYAGRAIYDGKETGRAGAWDPIVGDDVFALVQARLDDPRRKVNRLGTDRRHLGSGLFRCAVCERAVRSWSGGRYRCPDAHVNRSRIPVEKYVLAIVRERLSRPDLADLITPGESEEARELTEEATRLRVRLAQTGDDYDAGLIDGQRFKIATEKIRAELAAAESALARLTTGAGAAAILLAANPVVAFDDAPLMIRRSVLDALCVVRLASAPRGSRTFVPSTVEIEWRAA